VSAKDLGTGKEQKIEIKASSGLSSEEVDRMRKDAESHADDDKQRRELVDLKNQADQMVYSTEKTLSEHGEKVSAEDRTNVEQAINQLKDAQKGDDAEAIKKAIDALTAASHKLSEVMYKAAAEAAPGASEVSDSTGEPPPVGAAPAGQDSAKDDVIDAEFEVKE
jgi:molecular chaperone DnaK